MCLDIAMLYPGTQTVFTRQIQRVIRLSERLETGKRYVYAQNARCLLHPLIPWKCRLIWHISL